MEMKRQKNKGITMIGLVVTIIVMVVLAGVTISTIVGQKGIFSNMNKTQDQTSVDEEKRILKASVVNAMSKDSIGNVVKEKLQEELDKNIDEQYEIKSKENKTIEIIFEKTKNKYIILEDGTILTEEEYEKNVIFSIMPTSIPSLKIGQTKEIKCSTNIENVEVEWKSNDENIVKIVSNDINEKKITIKGISEGKTQIQAYIEIKDEKGNIQQVKTEICNVTITGESQTPVEDIKFPSSVQGKVIDLSSSVTTCELIPIIYPEEAKENVELKWESSKPSVASVDENGVVAGYSNGETTIKVTTNNGKYAETKIIVQTSPTEVTLNVLEMQIDIAKTKNTQIEATIKPETANVNTKLTWSSSNPDIIIENEDTIGNITVKNTGKALISVITENGCKADCVVNVIDSSKYQNGESSSGNTSSTNGDSDGKNSTWPWWLVVAGGTLGGVGAAVAGGTAVVVAAAAAASAAVTAVVTSIVGFFTGWW